MQISRLKELKAGLTQQLTCFTKIKPSECRFVTARCKLNRIIAMGGKCYSDGHFVKKCIVKTADIECLQNAQVFKDNFFPRNTVARRIEMADDLKQQLKAASSKL